MKSSVLIVGGGIVGLATGVAILRRHPGVQVVLVEKEQHLAAHQTGHNSGVIHAGIYYRPGTFKAKLCVEGARRMIAFCEESGIPWKRCGKVIIATRADELARLEELFARGVANEVPAIKLVDGDEAREIEPACAAIRAIHSPSTGIVDFVAVANSMATVIESAGGEIHTGTEITAIDSVDGELIATAATGAQFRTSSLINCGGLQADLVARLAGFRPSSQLVPFRGEYYLLREPAQSRIRGLIYPVPDPRFPWLGVHFTPRIDGTVEAGPNAVLAFAREGYKRTSFRWKELREILGYRGFRSMARRYWKVGLYELYRSASKAAFLKSLQRLVPDITAGDIEPGGAGVRALAVDPNGELIDDFQFEQSERALHVINAPSPAATASLAIGDLIAERASKTFNWRSQS